VSTCASDGLAQDLTDGFFQDPAVKGSAERETLGAQPSSASDSPDNPTEMIFRLGRSEQFPLVLGRQRRA